MASTRAPARELLVRHVEDEPPAGTSSSISSPFRTSASGPPTADSGATWRTHGAVRRPAHPGVGDPHHVLHALAEELLRNRELPPLRHAGAAARPASFCTRTRVSSTSSAGSLTRAMRSCLSTRRRPRGRGGGGDAVRPRRLLQHRAVRAEVALEDRPCLPPSSGSSSGTNHVGVHAPGRPAHVLARGSGRSPWAHRRGAAAGAGAGPRAARPRRRSPPSGTCPTGCSSR